MSRSIRRSVRGISALLAVLYTISHNTASHSAPTRALATPPAASGVVLPQTTRAVEAVRQKVTRGRALLDSGNRSSVAMLRGAAQDAVAPLTAIVGPQPFAPPPKNEKLEEFSADIIASAAQAHYWWGVAAENFGLRDESITALARATRLSNRVHTKGIGDVLERDALVMLRGVLRSGLPLVAADDTFETIAGIAHGDLWSPRRIRFDYSAVTFGPVSGPASDRQAQPQMRELLITSGKLFPPQNSDFDPGAGLSRTPPLYRTIDTVRLPPVLQLDKMIVGYSRETSGPNRGLWRQVVRVFYPSPFITKDSRDDRPRAEALCEQFLKIHSLTRTGLGLENLYASDGVTTLWLAEVSAWWPLDDEDPAIRAALPPLTKINTPLNPQDKPEIREIETTPLWQPWRAPGQTYAAPGEIMYFKMTEPRPESEWVRETAHEYGHNTLPLFDGFRPPLEPYANGLLGETLGMLWAAAAPDSFITQPAGGTIVPVSGAARSTLKTDFAAHVAREAVPALRLWNAQGPYSPLRGDRTSEGLRYLQGLTVYLERVYGANILGAAVRPLVARNKSVGDRSGPIVSLSTDSLINSFPVALRDPFAGSGVLPIWLPGAINTAAPEGTAPIIKREPLRLRGRERASCWLFIPPTAAGLNVEWRDARPSGTAGTLPVLKIEGGVRMLPAPASSNATKLARVDVSILSGWQRFTLTPTADVLVTGAYFTRQR